MAPATNTRAALDALDRGVIDAGLIAAEAIARAEAAEARCELLEARLHSVFASLADANRALGVTPHDPAMAAGPYEAALAVQSRRREMAAITGGAR